MDCKTCLVGLLSMGEAKRSQWFGLGRRPQGVQIDSWLAWKGKLLSVATRSSLAIVDRFGQVSLGSVHKYYSDCQK